MLFINSGYREVDLSVLSMCNHTIASTGTFSWWAGYLAGGQTIYCKNWPRAGSPMQKMINTNEYFLPHWIAL
jgi:galactoside 2-L-fucosyltransferase 1/2